MRKMPSLRKILNDGSSLLLIDAASAKIQVGMLGAAQPPRWAARANEAGVGIFECLDELGVDLDAVRSFAFCEGPGSILGIRTAAMAIRTWNVLRPRPTYAYGGLEVLSRALGPDAPGVIADARRGLWHFYPAGGPLTRVPGAELSGELATPEGFRHWDPLPPGTREVPYGVAGLLAVPAVAEADLFRETDAPDAFLHQQPSYVKWVPQIHRAP
jgi:tRNA threonylcarbamoyladenosine biosynthesis protein TsaB